MSSIKFATCQADNARSLARCIVEYVGERVGVPVDFVDDVSWQERESLFDSGHVHVLWMCGLPYVQRADKPNAGIELLAAPVMSGARYKGQPVYFSDVVVHRKSRCQSFADLQGSIWAYNEPNSHSGHNLVRYHLAAHGAPGSFFDDIVESGSHQVSLQLILDRRVDVSAIDSTVLESELRRDSSIRSRIRIIDTLGPSPIPPWVVRTELSPTLRSAIRAALLLMSATPRGRDILASGSIRGFAPVTDGDYDAIRRMSRSAEWVSR